MAADRFVLKQFAGSATNNGAFGAAQATGVGVQPVADIKDVQSLSAFEQGWNAATLTSDKLPALEEMQGLEALLCKALKENYSEGIPFWIAGETYFQYSFVNYNGVLYYNTTGSYTNNNPATDTANWAQYKPATAGAADTAAVADKLGTSTVGSVAQGIYLKNGVPTPMTTEFANQDLSNLTVTGENHFVNPALTNSPYTTNRILEIPQDIKLELNNGTLTLKAGSKVYVPNGFESDGVTPKFDVVTIQSDKLTTNTQQYDYKYVVLYNIDTTEFYSWYEGVFLSGPTQPVGYPNCIWYDTTNNIIKLTTNSFSTWTKVCLPLGIIQQSSSGITTSIDQIFNGFGYIGSTVFALPGVKVQIPNGRNEDGTNKSILVTTTVVSTNQYNGVVGIMTWFIDNQGYVHYFGNNALTYNENTNFYEDPSGNTYLWVAFAESFYSTGKVSNYKPCSVDSVANSNASNFSQAGRSYLSGIGMPSSRYENWTLGASGATYTAPANGYIQVSKHSSGGGQYLNISIQKFYTGTGASDAIFIIWSTGASQPIAFTVPLSKGDKFFLYYSLGGATNTFKFIYAEGEV